MSTSVPHKHFESEQVSFTKRTTHLDGASEGTAFEVLDIGGVGQAGVVQDFLEAGPGDRALAIALGELQAAVDEGGVGDAEDHQKDGKEAVHHHVA